MKDAEQEPREIQRQVRSALKPPVGKISFGEAQKIAMELASKGVLQRMGSRSAAAAPSAEPVAEPVAVGVVVPETAERFSGVTVAFEQLSPQVASEWLRVNTHNRNLRGSAVESYARDMRAGEWITNHQGIAFAADGRLLDGQHRLHAVVESGVTVLMMVTRGWPTTTGKRVLMMDTVDVGAGRSLADLLKLQHAAENPRVVTSSAGVLAQIAIRKVTKRKNPKLSMSTLLLIASAFAEGLRFVCQAAPKNIGLRKAEVLAVVAAAYETDPARVGEFLARLKSGAGLQDDSPILHLRNYLTNPQRVGYATFLSGVMIVAAHLREFLEGKPTHQVIRGDASAVEWLAGLRPEGFRKVAGLFGVDHE